MTYQNTLSFARKLDKNDPLRSFRKEFSIPKAKGKPMIYLTGNSLGLQPKQTKKYVLQELEDWANLGVEGHVKARRPWVNYQNQSKKILAALLGAKSEEVVSMNQLTVNLHLLMVSFYRPTTARFKIITEAGAFSSDQYAFESQIKYHGFDPNEALIELKPRDGEATLRTEDILSAIETHASELALVIFGGVQYYSGQFFDIKKIAEAGHAAGAYVGFDLAHAIGNVVLNLHDHNVDFATWCSYKYLNSGPGGISGIFVHDRFHNEALPRFSGWWGHDEKERFKMQKGFKPMPGADGWQLSNHAILPGAAHLASLDLFKKAGMKNLRKKSELLTGYLEFILGDIDPEGNHFTIITPREKAARGCQLSLRMNTNGPAVYKNLLKNGVSADWREPGVIRVAPVPFYNSFEDVFNFGVIFKKALRLSK